MTSTTGDTTTRTGSAAADPFEGCLSSVGTALAGVADTPAWVLSEDAVQARLTQALRIRARVEELTVRLLGSVVDREIPRVAGASSARAWLMATHGMSVQDAARLVRETALRSVDEMTPARSEPTRAAWAAGEVSAEQAVLIAKAVDRLSGDVPEHAVEALQADLVGHAQTLSYVQLQHVCRHAVEVVDPGGADAALAARLEAEEARALQLCELRLRRSGDGWTGFSGRLPDAQADMFKKALDASTSPRHHRAVATGPHHTATDPDPGDGGPSYQQRLGRAFAELIEHLPIDKLPQHGVANATVVITISLDQLKTGLGEAMLDTGTAMSPGQGRRLACNAGVIPAVLGANSAILDLGLAQRLYDRHQRIALAVRDRGCTWPGCDRPPLWCEAHHIISWADGGPTDPANGCLLCPFHHHLVHANTGWQIQTAPDGIPEVIPPERLDPTRQPRRHERLTRRQC
ncbi:MAG: HNH endonuclease [Actinomycetota bacterium]|nr:HNH endonuclease [Actinomycetota bacterium]